MSYFGGKQGSGVYQRIINLIPRHRVYIEAFAGHAAVLRKKKAAASTLAVDLDADVCEWLRRHSEPGKRRKAFTVIHGDAIQYLRNFAWRGDEFVYCDPPYVRATRRSPRDRYRYELSDADHAQLLSVLSAIPAAVMLSGYRSALYDDALSSWHRIDYTAATRRGPATESLWLNYRPPSLLHDYRYVGADFRERERIAKKRDRWVSRLMAMPDLERNAIFGALIEAMRDRPSPDALSVPAAAGDCADWYDESIPCFTQMETSL
jgi:site-specific DNA-adenine methylase